MSYYQQRNRHRLSIGQDGNALTMLIAVNLVAFVILAFVKVIYYFSNPEGGVNLFHNNFFNWLILPADLNTFFSRPWTLITHMFVHDTDNVWLILGNMIWLWSFGYILQDLAGSRQIIPLFLYGALAGAIAFMVAYNIPALKSFISSPAFGASAGLMAIAIGVTTLAPNYRIFPMLNGGIPVWVITVLYAIIDLAFIPKYSLGGYINHIAGALMGFLYMVMLQRGKDWGNWMNSFYDWTSNLFNPDKPKKGKSVKSQLFYKATVQPFTKTPTVTQQRVDEILDKIGQKGYNSLSEDEKEILKRASKDDLL